MDNTVLKSRLVKSERVCRELRHLLSEHGVVNGYNYYLLLDLLADWLEIAPEIKYERPTVMKINKNRPVEPLTGDNYGIVKHILGNVHCMSPIKEQLKRARPPKIRQVPPKLRRGWVQTCLEIIKENRELYTSVTTGQFK